MAQYISKSALVAEIEKLKAYLQIPNAQLEAIKVCDNVISAIDTLEVKEVDLEKEISNYLDNHNLNIQDGCRIVFNNGDTPNFLCDFRDIAKHFFELGLKSKGE